MMLLVWEGQGQPGQCLDLMLVLPVDARPGSALWIRSVCPSVGLRSPSHLKVTDDIRRSGILPMEINYDVSALKVAPLI